MKKLYGILLLSALILCSCGEKETEPTTTAAESTTTAEPTTTETETATTESKKFEPVYLGGDDTISLYYTGVHDGYMNVRAYANNDDMYYYLIPNIEINGDKYESDFKDMLSDDYDLDRPLAEYYMNPVGQEPGTPIPIYESGTMSGTFTYMDENSENEKSFEFKGDF